MRNLFQFKLRTDSLFIRLFISFLIIIVLLLSFNIFSFSFFRDNIRDEIIRYNLANLNNTTESFEIHFQLINNLVLGLYLNEDVQLLINDKNINYSVTTEVRREIRDVIANHLLHFENVVLYFKESSFILDMSGSTRAESMFTKFYRSNDYPYSFWENEFTNDYQYRIYPASTFSEIVFNNVIISNKLLFPIIIKNLSYPEYYFVAFIDANKLINAYHRSINENFYMLDERGNRLFALNNTDEHMLPILDYKQSYVKQGKYYYFYQKGTQTGITYVNIIPDEYISSQIVRLNYTLVSLLIISIAISIIVSLLFSMRINNPVKQIIKSMQHFNNQSPVPASRIKEFNVISEQLTHMNQTNQTIHQDLVNKNSLLRNYAYTNKLKRIHSDFHDFKDLFISNKPFLVVLFHLNFKNYFYEKIDTETDRATYFIREYIDHTLAQKFPDAHTFQIENDQILSLIFTTEHDPTLMEMMEHLKHVFDLDNESCSVTIAFSSMYKHSAKFTEAYEQAVERIQLRKMIDETQIILEGSKQDVIVAETPALEKECDAYMQAGNVDALIQLLHKVLAQLEKKQAVAADYHRYGEQLYKKVRRELAAMNVAHELHNHEELSKQLANCHNVHQLRQFLEQLLFQAAGLIKEKREERDHITSFVNAYIEEHYQEDISLEAVADKMNITSGYLSFYFKEKTGRNFIDYLNEVRINKAKTALLQSGQRVQDIAAQVGYQNMNSFYRMFKKHAGLTPNEFRRMKEK